MTVRKEKSAGAVVFRRGRQREFLLLHYGKSHWGFPKGHVEEGETEEQALFRELQEETGITRAEITPGFREEVAYFFREGRHTISKTVAFYLLESKEREVRLSPEHSESAWLPFEQAIERLSFTNTKNLLKKANALLQQPNQKNK